MMMIMKKIFVEMFVCCDDLEVTIVIQWEVFVRFTIHTYAALTSHLRPTYVPPTSQLLLSFA